MNIPEPRVIPRQDHPISRQLLSPNALRVLYRLRDSGYTAYLVGGCVRDLLLGREPKDYDVATDATPPELKRLFRNCRLIGRRFRLAHIHFRDELIEVATFRAMGSDDPAESAEEGEQEGAETSAIVRSDDGIILRDNLFGTPAEDALRRDFTVNSLFYNIGDFSIIDHAGGLEDLEAGVIRTIGDPRVRFTEDPVRMLRAVRFAALLGFRIGEETWEALCECAPLIAHAAPARLYEEFLKLFLSGEGEACYQLLRKGGIFDFLFPKLAEWLGTEHDNFPHAGIGRGLERVDALAAEGRKVSPGLLLAFMFGEFVEERAAETTGMAYQEALSAAIEELFATPDAVIRMHRSALLQGREILSLQRRLKKIPGKRPASVAARPAFADALEYFRDASAEEAGAAKILAWWEKGGAAGAVPPPTAPPSAEGEKPRPRRRRRRRRKPAATTES